jgi:hypothetical protein
MLLEESRRVGDEKRLAGSTGLHLNQLAHFPVHDMPIMRCQLWTIEVFLCILPLFKH